MQREHSHGFCPVLMSKSCTTINLQYLPCIKNACEEHFHRWDKGTVTHLHVAALPVSQAGVSLIKK